MRHNFILFCILSFSLSLAGGCVQKRNQLAYTRPSELKFKFISSFGSTGSGPGEFLHPEGLSISQSGDIYVADTGNNRIQVFDSRGNFIRQKGDFGWEPATFNRPTALWAKRGFKIYVADSYNRRLQVFDIDLNFIGEITDTGYIKGVAVSEHGDIYISENNEVMKLSQFGEIISSFGSGRLFNPAGIALGREGKLFVCDRGNNRIALFNSFGDFIGSFGSEVLMVPEDVDIGKLGEIIVADTGNHRIAAFNERGEVLSFVGDKGKGPGSFLRPSGVAFGPGGSLFILDTGNNRIQKFEVLFSNETRRDTFPFSFGFYSFRDCFSDPGT